MKHVLFALLLTIALPACAVAQDSGASSSPPGAAAGYEGAGGTGPEIATVPRAEEPNTCNLNREWVGKKLDRKAVEAAAKALRIMHPGDPATMDYSPDRMNVMIDDKEIVVDVTCG